MSKQKPVIKNSVDLLKNIIWQYDGNNVLASLIAQKGAWYNQCHAEFWQNWFQDVFDLRTANDFGLSIWAKILGISFYIPDCSIQLTTEQKRFVCRLRYYQLITRCTIPEVNGILKDMFTTAEGKAYALDPNDMSNITYVFTYQPDSAIATILLKYDLLPRPAAVGINYRVLTYKPFGFGHHYTNFGASTFWNGGRLDNYYGKIILSFDENSGVITGILTVNEKSIVITDIDVQLKIIKVDGSSETVYLQTDLNGQFNYKLAESDDFTIKAKAQLITPVCTTINVESNNFTVNYIDFNPLITDEEEFYITEDGFYLITETISPFDYTPQPVVKQRLIETPYFLNQAVGHISMMCKAPNKQALAFDLETSNSVNDFVNEGEYRWAGALILKQNVEALQNQWQIKTDDTLILPSPALIDDEIINITGYRNGVITVERGCADTIPMIHAENATIWILNREQINQQKYQSGEVIYAKALTKTEQGVLEADNALLSNVTMNNRSLRPYPPGNVRLNGESMPFPVIDAYKPFRIEWVGRNRITQGDTLIDYLAPDVESEKETEYVIELYRYGEFIREISTKETYWHYPDSFASYKEFDTLRLYSIRDGLKSLFGYEFKVFWSDRIFEMKFSSNDYSPPEPNNIKLMLGE